MKYHLLAVMILMGLFMVLSCQGSPAGGESSSSSSSSIPSNLNLKSYMGAASIGDIVWYGIDANQRVLQFSNISRGYTWSSSYSDAGDGTMKFTIPVINEEAYFIEIPDKLLVVLFTIWDNGVKYPAFAVLVPQTVTSSEGMTNLNGPYFFLDAKRWDSGEYNGLYELHPSAVYITPSNVSLYDGEANSLTNSWTIPIGFSDDMGMCYAVSRDNGNISTNYFVASAATVVLDKGINKGISFGAKVREATIPIADLEGNYIMMALAQNRDNNLLTNEVMKGFIKLSNTGNYLDVYIGTNETSLDKVGVLQMFHFGSTDGRISGYGLVATNGGGGIVLGSDLTHGFIIQNDGNPYNTNEHYFALMGFVKKR